jgi:hypothetical protein
VKEEDLITYCGGYGGTCARWCGYFQFRATAGLLAEWVDAQGYQHWMPAETREFDYREFRKGLEFFRSNDSWLVCNNCCKGGNGNPDCEIRKCCRERRLEICFDCGDFPCAKVQEDSGMKERAREYQALGKSEWLRRQAEKARLGFEGHTRKYYGIRAEEQSPEA